jgi:hydrogenase maturation protease
MLSRRAKILVLGLGNDILTDDAVGLHIAELAAKKLADEPDVEVRTTTEMGLALLDELADRRSVVLVDAVQTGRAPAGHVHEFGPEELPAVMTTSPHFLGLGETLELGRLVGAAMPREVHIVAIEVADPYTLGTALTPAVQAAVSPAVERVCAHARALAARARA